MTYVQKVQKLTTRMADGREIIWFDGPDHAPRDPAGLVTGQGVSCGHAHEDARGSQG